MDIEKLVIEAKSGNKIALEGVVASVQDRIYALALRMLVNPDDALEATQEILIKVITNLSSFRFESQFSTWVHKVATNYLISEKKVLNKYPNLTFGLFKHDLESDLQEPLHLRSEPSYQAMLNELRISCTMAMLLCLNPTHRMAYILGDIYEMEHSEASDILSVTKDNFRKMLSRARNKVIEFSSNTCGHVNSCAKCSCDKKLSGAVARQRVNPNKLFYANNANYTYADIQKSLSKTQQDLKTLSLQQSIGQHKCPVTLGNIIECLVVDGVKARSMLN